MEVATHEAGDDENAVGGVQCGSAIDGEGGDQNETGGNGSSTLNPLWRNGMRKFGGGVTIE